MAASFGNAAYERLPLEEEDSMGLPLGQTIPQQLQRTEQQLLTDSRAQIFQGMGGQNLLNSMQPSSDAYGWASGAPPSSF